MRIILFTLMLLGFASAKESRSDGKALWRSGRPGSLPCLLNSRVIRKGNTSFKPTAGGHLQSHLATPPRAPRLAASQQPASANNTGNTSPPKFKLTLQNYLQHLTDSLHAEIGVACRDLETGREFFFNERQMMHAASTMKVPVMIEVFRQAEKNKFRLEDSVRVKNEFHSLVDGSPYSLDMTDDSDASMYRALGMRMTIRQLVEQMITVSSNLATNMLIERVGAANVMATLRELGIQNMQVRRGVEDTKAYQLGWNNQTDAFDLMLVLQAIAEKRAASPEACDSMLAILQRQKFREGIPADLPSGTVVGNKTGSITAIAHDGAIVFPNFASKKRAATPRRPYVLVVLTKGIAEEKAAERVIAAISRRIYEGLRSAQW